MLAVAVAGCTPSFAEQLPLATAPVVAPAPHKATHGVPGESMELSVDLRGMTVGRVQVAVGQPGTVDGRPAIIIRSRAVSAGFVSIFGDLTWDLTTTLDLETGTALREEEEVHIKIPGKAAEHEKRERSQLSGLNAHAVAGQLRAWHSKLGEQIQTEVTFNDFTLALELVDAGREIVGKFPAVRYEGTLKHRYPIKLWISDDESRVPLRMIVDSKLGTVAVELVDYDAPKDH